MAVLPVAIRPERVAQEVERFRASVANTRLRVIERQPDTSHPLSRPCQRGHGVTLAHDDEIVRIGDEPRSVLLPFVALPPRAKEAMHVDVGEQRADDTTLRRAPCAA